jgi:formate hydrogenlyase transcriptional activator
VETQLSGDVIENRLALETLISDSCAALFAAPMGEVGVAVERALDRLRDFFSADCCQLASLSADSATINVVHATHAEGVPRVFLPSRCLQGAKRVLADGNPTYWRIDGDTSAEAGAGGESVAQVLLVPIHRRGEANRLVILSGVSRAPGVLAERIQVLGGILISALERQAAFTQLRDAEERMTLAADSAEAGFWALDFRTGLHWGTERALAIFGLGPNELLSVESFEALVHPDDLGNVRTMLERSRHEAGPLNVEYRIVLANGDVRWVASRGRTRFASTGDPERLTGVTIDITQRRLAEEALRQSYAEIERLKDHLVAEGEYLKAEIKIVQAHGDVTGKSAPIQRVLRMVEQVAPTTSTVLIRGETGTGKELIAQAIHRLSPRRHNVMVKVNCAALPSGLVESELFGREKGAFTGALMRQTGRFEVANGSTLFLDEVGELSLDVQSKLLRVLETGEFERLGSSRTINVDVRLIAATNRDLSEAIKQGKFRQDLYYRLNVFPICVPPLRERKDDIPLLVWAFLQEFSARMGKKITQISRKTMETLERHSWPGNVRELRNVIEHGAIITMGDTLRIPMLETDALPDTPPKKLVEAERDHILKALARSGWRVKGPRGAAAELGLNPATLFSRMKKLGIQSRGLRDDERG